MVRNKENNSIVISLENANEGRIMNRMAAYARVVNG